MALKLAYYGESILRKKGEPVKEIDDEIRAFVHEMVETMRAHNGIGLAAPQVFKSLRIFVMSVPRMNAEKEWEAGPLYVFINPTILDVSDETWTHSEGCLSIPAIYTEVTRPYYIKVQGTNLEGEEFTVEFEGMEARCFLHENDHINGVLFVDRIRGKERKKLDSLLRDVKNKYYHKK